MVVSKAFFFFLFRRYIRYKEHNFFLSVRNIYCQFKIPVLVLYITKFLLHPNTIYLINTMINAHEWCN